MSRAGITRLAWLLVGALALQIVVILFAFCRYPAVGTDDIWSASTAYTFLTKGVFGRSISTGAYGSEVRDYFPPGNPLLLIASYRLFGFGIWQTKIVALLGGLLTTLVVARTAYRLTGNDRVASLYSAVLLSANIPSLVTWQSGRYDSPSIFFATAATCVALGAKESAGPTFSRTFFVGLLSGFAVVTYYPFALPFLGAPTLALLSQNWGGRDGRTGRVVRILGGMASGGLCVGIPLLWHILEYPGLFEKQILAQRAFYEGQSVWTNLVNEPQRYWHYATTGFGAPELLVAAGAVWWLFQASTLARAQRVAILGGMAIWGVWLAGFGMKGPAQIAFMFPCIALAVAITIGAVMKRATSRPLTWTFAMGTAGVAVFYVAKLAIVIGTLVVQWHGRDYDRFAAELHQHVPTGANVIGAGTVWYALAPTASQVRTLSQGGAQTEYFEMPWLNDLRVLDGVTHVIFRAGDFENPALDQRFHSLKTYLTGRFERVGAIRMPFRPLPWAARSPYDVDVYERLPKWTHRDTSQGVNH